MYNLCCIYVPTAMRKSMRCLPLMAFDNIDLHDRIVFKHVVDLVRTAFTLL